MDSTHTVLVKTENKGLRILVGLICVIIWARWWWFGSLYEAFIPQYAQTHAPGQVNNAAGNATATLLQLGVDLLWGIGTIVIGVLSMGKAMLTDIVEGLAQFVRGTRDAPNVVKAVKSEATTTATLEASRRAIDGAKLSAVLESHESRITALESPARPAYKRTTRHQTPKGK